MSPYLMSLLEPEEHCAKIPDVCGYPTTTFSQVMEGTLTTNATGDTAIMVYPTCMNPSATGLVGGPVLVGTGTTANVWATGSGVVAPKSATIATNFSLFRPVSAALDLEFIGSTSSDQGQLVVGPVMRGELASNTFAGMAQNEFAMAIPLRNGARILWKPQDLVDLQFEPTFTANITGIAYTAPNSPATSGAPSSSLGSDQPRAALVGIVAGAAASATVIRYRFTTNFEAVPESDTLGLFEITPKECNTSLIDSAMNYVSQVPWATAWQKAGGLVDALARETLSAQLPTVLGAVGSYGMRRMFKTSTPQGRIAYDYPLD